MLEFSSEEEAIQKLADLTKGRVLIAASLKDLMPKLKDRIKKKSREDLDDEELENVILNLAAGDPKFRGDLNQNVKPINVFIEWYIKDPSSISADKMDMIAEQVGEFNKMMGQGRTDKKLKDFDTARDFLKFTFDLSENEAKDKDKDIKAKFLSSPDSTHHNIKAYYIDEEWEDVGRALFEEQTKWCVNEESNYDNYKPLYLFTEDDHYHALYSPGEQMFNDARNDEIDMDQYEKLKPILKDLDLASKVEEDIEGISESLREPPYEEEGEYAESAWGDWVEDSVIKNLEKSYGSKIEEYREKNGNDSIWI